MNFEAMMQPPAWIAPYIRTCELMLRGTFNRDGFTSAAENASQRTGFGASMHRSPFVERYSWGIPNVEGWDLIFEAVRGKSCLEIGAGSGFLAQSITANAQPNKYVATDARQGHTFTESYFDILKMDHNKALDAYPSAEVLIINWPTYDAPWAFEALQRFTGNTLIYIGEHSGGCTADDQFFEELEEKWEEEECRPCVQWWGINDFVFIYKRK